MKVSLFLLQSSATRFFQGIRFRTHTSSIFRTFFFFGKSSKSLSFPGFFPGFLKYKQDPSR
ncbi:hypothetical protein LEP1GSC036_0512 [Leptospira weilii str. 2006001853]|uniref:Uncharacterized protein n=1 Tax=Leptospira weilii str. 2006001853 TaxID=1001589 RepID=A0A828Z4M4_9LEPT|nr:hypothetical protein LEP1GSC036_0512 [Leptospira weilii str. 2006001853]